MKDSFKSIILFFIISSFLGMLLLFSLGSSLSSEVANNNGELKVYIHFNSSEGGLTPYGYEAYLIKWYKPKAFVSESSMFFSGHCGSEGPKVNWINQNSLELRCEHPQYIALKKSEIKGVKITYTKGNGNVF